MFPVNKNLKVKAFTVMEVTISMILAAIVIMLAYTVYHIISKGYINFEKKNQELATVLQLDQILKFDFNNSALILRVPEGLYIDRDNQIIIYEFLQDAVLRKSAAVDTFKLSVNDKIFAFGGYPVKQTMNHYNLLINKKDTLSIEKSRIDEMSFTLRFRNVNLKYSYHKNYSSANLFQRNAYAIN